MKKKQGTAMNLYGQKGKEVEQVKNNLRKLALF